VSTATLAGYRVTSARLQIPAWGVGWAEVSLDEEATLSGRVELVVADLTWSGTVVSGGPSGGRSQYRLVGGAGGWGRKLAAKGYANDVGVKVSTVAQDAAQEAGETLVGDVPTSSLGPAWTRCEGQAARTMEAVAPRGWYVDEAGDTRIGRRAPVELAVDATLGPPDLSVGRRVVSADAIATILPGVVIEGREVVDVLHEIGGGKGIRSTVWWGLGTADRSVEDAFIAYVMRLLPWVAYARAVEYRVVTQSGDRFALQPVLSSLGMPDLDAVPARPGIPGVRADVALGSRVVVQWVNADPARPYVAAYEDAESDGFVATRLDLSTEDETGVTVGDSVGRVVRYGDPITFAAPGPGVVLLPATAPLSPVRA
jgi:hypothetical protein